MANIKLLQASKGGASMGCGCGCTDGELGSGSSPNPLDLFTVRHKPGTEIGNVIMQYNENGKLIYELDDLSLVEPIVAFSNDAGTREVGETVALVTFTGTINQGTHPIISREITPDPGGVNLNVNPFSFQKVDVKRTTPGAAELHTVAAEDDQGNISSVASSVLFKDAFFQGFNASPTLTEVQIKALANKHKIDSILQQYGGSKSYVVPGPDAKYIYWVGPVGTPIIGGASLGGFMLPLVDVGPIVVTNPHDPSLTLPYWVKRTSNKFDPGTYSIAIS